MREIEEWPAVWRLSNTSFYEKTKVRSNEFRLEEVYQRKIVLIGDGAVGKTCLYISHVNKSFPEDYVPTVFDNYTEEFAANGVTYQVGLWDTGGGEDYSRLRPLSYPCTDCFIVAFSLVGHSHYPDMHSFEQVRDRLVNYWIAEIKHYCPGTPFIIVGTKQDLVLAGQPPVMNYEQGESIAYETGALAYLECSAKTCSGIEQVIETAVTAREATGNKRQPKRRTGAQCIIQ